MRVTLRDQWRCFSCLAVGCCVIWQGAFTVEAGSLYVYTDAQGQAVLTDNLQHVPPEFRGRLRTVTGGESPAAGAVGTGQEPVASQPPSSNVIQSILHLVAQKVHPIQGLTAHQTAVLIVAGACLVALLCLLFVTSNPAIRLLAKCLLMLVSLMALYQLAVGGAVSVGPLTGTSPQASEQVDNLMGKVKTLTQQGYRLQDERTTHQLDQAEPSTP
jgi:hypothetical protein